MVGEGKVVEHDVIGRAEMQPGPVPLSSRFSLSKATRPPVCTDAETTRAFCVEDVSCYGHRRHDTLAKSDPF